MHNKKTTAWRKVSVRFLTIALLGGLAEASWALPAQAADSGTNLRVGLMISADAFNTAVDTVTLQSKSGLLIGFYQNGVFASRYDAAGAQASLDNYYILVGETDSLDAAGDLADSVDQLGLTADIYSETRGGKKVYQVVNGYYETRSNATNALSRLKSVREGATLRGYNRLTTGPVVDQASAQSKASALRAQGFDAYPVVRKGGTWEVWIGNEASSDALAALKSAVSAKVPGTYATADYNPADYILLKTGVYGGQEVPHTIQNSTVEEIAFVPKNQGTIKVAEKAREYRGSILIQGYRELANVINYVPVEQYLYGLVPREMSTGWPLEALKAQAVAARTYAMRSIGSEKWGVSDLVDDTYDQAYYGTKLEASDTTKAVDDTAGKVLRYSGKLIEALYSSNNGGQDGDVSEMWGSKGFPYLISVDSKFDSVAADSEPLYYRIQLPAGQIGWIMAKNVTKGSKNSAGFATGTVVSSGPMREIPERSATVMDTPDEGTRVVILAEEKEYNTYNWQRGPYSPTEMGNMIGTGPVSDLRVTKWGQGGRMMEVSANGKVVPASSPDSYRAVFDDLWSTKVQIEQQGTYTVLGANGRKTEYPNSQKLNVISASGSVTTAVNGANNSFVLLNGSGENRVVTKQQSFILHGNGYGHGLGMSQWGANGMAKNGYTYDQILAHYYPGTSLTNQ